MDAAIFERLQKNQQDFFQQMFDQQEKKYQAREEALLKRIENLEQKKSFPAVQFSEPPKKRPESYYENKYEDNLPQASPAVNFGSEAQQRALQQIPPPVNTNKQSNAKNKKKKKKNQKKNQKRNQQKRKKYFEKKNSAKLVGHKLYEDKDGHFLLDNGTDEPIVVTDKNDIEDPIDREFYVLLSAQEEEKKEVKSQSERKKPTTVDEYYNWLRECLELYGLNANKFEYEVNTKTKTIVVSSPYRVASDEINAFKKLNAEFAEEKKERVYKFKFSDIPNPDTIDIFSAHEDNRKRGMYYRLNNIDINNLGNVQTRTRLINEILRAKQDALTRGFPGYKMKYSFFIEITRFKKTEEEGKEKRAKKYNRDIIKISTGISELDFQNPDFEKFISEIKKKVQGFYEGTNVIKQQLHIVPAPIGGCFTQANFSHPFKCTNLGDKKLKNPKSDNNNCGFYCFREEINLKLGRRITKQLCNVWRKEYHILPNAMMPINALITWAKDKLNLDIGVMNQSEEFFGAQGKDANVLLVDKHYIRIENITRRTCENCGVEGIREIHDRGSCIRRNLLMDNKRTGKKYVIPKRLRTREFDNKEGDEKSSKSSPSGKSEMDYTIHYDIETFKLPNGKQEPNALGCAYRDYETKEIIYRVFTGEDCMEKFVRLLTNELWYIRWINAFNGAKFDHLPLIEAEMKVNNVCLSSINPLKTPSGIISAKIANKLIFTKKDPEGKMTSKKIVDLSRHLLGTLKANLESFKCKVQKGEFDYDKNRAWPELPLKDQTDLLNYLKADVLGLLELSEKYHDVLVSTFNTSWVHWPTTSTLTYNLWMHHLQERLNEKILHLPTSREYEFIRKAIIGGRTSVHRKFFKSLDYDKIMEKVRDESLPFENRLTLKDFNSVDDYLVDLDVSSLYPFAMCNPMPTGEPYEVKGEEECKKEFESGRLGIFKVTYVSNKKLLIPPFARKEDGKNIWDLNDGEQALTSIDIQTSMNLGYKFKFHEGLVWPTSEEIFTTYLKMIYKMKEEAEKDSPAYFLAKLMSNALYGKTLQKPNFTKHIFLSDAKQWNDIFPKYYIDSIDSESFEDWIVSVTVKDQELRDKQISKPYHVGCFILAYTRKIMMDYFMKLNPNNDIDLQFYYTDTDSIQVHARVVKASGIDFTTKGLGNLANELNGNGKIIKGIWIAPKMYMLQYIYYDKELDKVLFKEKIVGKGVKKILTEELVIKKNPKTAKKELVVEKVGKIPLSQDDFEAMQEGKTVEVTNKDVFKRHIYKLNKTEKENDMSYFSVSIHDMKKSINSTPYEGRIFNEDGNSVPMGYRY